MKIKKVLLYLTALSLLGSIVPGVQATDNNIEGNYFVANKNNNQNYSYEPLEIKSIFNMTEEEASKKINPKYTWLFNVMFNDLSTMSIPCTRVESYLIKDEEKELGNNPEKLKYRYGILLSTLSSMFDDETYNKTKDQPTIYIYRSLVDDSVVGAQFADKTKIFPNKKYFYELNENKYAVDSEIWMFYDYARNVLSKRDDLNREERNRISEATDTEVMLDEYREKFYKSFVSIYNWPVSIKKEITNESLPVFEEDFLNISLESMPNLMLYEIFDGNGNFRFLLLNFDPLEKKYYDFFTNINLGTRNGLEKVVKNTYDSQAFPETFMSGAVIFSKLQEYTSISEQRILEVMYDFLEDVQKEPTVRGLIDSYIRLPKEYTVDYSNFDFSKNPNVVQPDKSSVIVDPKGSFMANLFV